jgi:hypothetical protein
LRRLAGQQEKGCTRTFFSVVPDSAGGYSLVAVMVWKLPKK